ncbi:MAG TPA: NosD domain-containing protein, partial [Candidatus Sulfotelmatobacter sp.]|nr:NosD domain-containing protein [Candidatus Sulfotelmatobacter sp.]
MPSDAGYVVLDNCTNIIVKNLLINRNSTGYYYHGSSGISLIRTRNSTISGNIANGTTIYISYSSENILIVGNKIINGSINSWGSNVSIIENSIIASMDNGISLGGPNNVVVTKNSLIECKTGINLQQSSQTKITQNNITNCTTGISLFSSNNNAFYQNNFINNEHHVSEQHSSLQWPLETYYQSVNNTWDGNFWSDYNGPDSNG